MGELAAQRSFAVSRHGWPGRKGVPERLRSPNAPVGARRLKESRGWRPVVPRVDRICKHVAFRARRPAPAEHYVFRSLEHASARAICTRDCVEAVWPAELPRGAIVLYAVLRKTVLIRPPQSAIVNRNREVRQFQEPKVLYLPRG